MAFAALHRKEEDIAAASGFVFRSPRFLALHRLLCLPTDEAFSLFYLRAENAFHRDLVETKGIQEKKKIFSFGSLFLWSCFFVCVVAVVICVNVDSLIERSCPRTSFALAFIGSR